MTNEERLYRLENKVDKLQDQAHAYHLELLSCITKSNDAMDEEINNLKLTVDRHQSYFGLVLKALGLGGILTSWLSLKDLLHK